MNNNLKRTIIHEIGHFVATELNHRLFESGKCLSIKLTGKTVNGGIDYKGLTEADVNIDKDEETKMKLLSQRIAVLVYGCYFQCLYEGKALNDCFGFNNPSLNGAIDRQMYNTVFPYDVGREQRIKAEQYLNLYLNSLEEFKGEFDKIFNQDFKSILREEENNIQLNLAQLKEKINDFLDSHLKKFKEFHENINSIKNEK